MIKALSFVKNISWLLTLFTVVIFILLLHVQSTYASDQKNVLATVNGEDITLEEVELAVEFLPQQFRRLPKSDLVPLLREELIDMKLLTSYALKAGLVKTTDIAVRKQFYEMRLVYDYFVGTMVNENLTDDILQERYKLFLEEFIGEDEIKTSHILVSNKEIATNILLELAEGLDFAQAAKTYSIGPSAAQGGDIGFITKNQVVPEFGAVAFKLEIGETSEPVKSQFGWHIIKVLEKRKETPPSYINIEETLKAQAVDDLIRQEATKARSTAKIEYFDGEFVEH